MFRQPNRAVWWVVTGAALGMSLIITVPFLRDLFHFSVLHPADLVLCVAAGALTVLWFEILKLTPFWKHNRDSTGPRLNEETITR